MAGSAERKEKSMNSKKKKMKSSNKRKLSNSSDIHKPSKKSHITKKETEKIQQQFVEEMEILQEKMIENYQWRNLELALSIQSKEIKPQQKVELIFDFVISRALKRDTDEAHEFNTLSISRLILYISNWIQSLLITSEKKIHTKDKESVESQFCLDYRCWQLLKYCLEESSRRHVSLSLSRDLLKVISCVARSTLHQLDHLDNDIKKSSFFTTECQIYTTINDCLKLVFSSHGRLLNENLDLWIVTASSLLELVIKTFAHGLQDSDVGNLITELSCLVLEQFSKFLTVHPYRKNGFRDFVEKLLEPLLHVLGVLPEHIRDDGDSMVQKLFNFVQEIVSYGLFHVVHLDEYLSLHGTEKYSSLVEWKLENARTLVKSYLRHLFDKLENLVSKRKVEALSGIGEMFHLFVICVKKHKKDSQDSDALRSTGTQSTNDPSKISNLISEKSKISSWNMRKSFFDFFVLSTEPLLLDLGTHLQSNIESKTFLNDVNITLKSVNKILSTMVRERIYVRTEDDSGGACLSFFKISYGLLLSCYAKVSQLWNSKWDPDILGQVEVLHSVAKEFVFVIRSFLEIEYEVIGDDLVSTWLMILTFLAMGQFSEADVELCPLFSEALNLACRVINLYGELRQVNLALFALCKALRHLAFYQVNDKMKSSEVSPSDLSLNGDKFAKSGHLLLSAQQFRLAICNAIKSIPEGQANEYVQILSADISDSLEWMKVTCSIADEHEFGDAKFHHKCSVKDEILGIVFSEIYSLILESIPLTTGNSYRTGVSLENLMGLLGPSMTLLVEPEQNGLDPFIFSVLGITSQSDILKCKKGLQDKAPFLLLFFFRLYVSCRSLYRQTLSLMPPKFTKKMSGMMADLSTAYSGDDMLEMTDFEDEGYFSWVVRPSCSLLSMVSALKSSIIKETSAYHSLIYVMHIMILQRLGDLKRQIHCVEYIVQRSENVISGKLLDDVDLSGLRKKKRKQDKFLSGLKQEAACLTGFIMEHMSATDDRKSGIYMELGSWDLGVCTVNEKTLYISLWWIICQNIDIWCHYATKKDLKLFLSQLIFNSLKDERDQNFEEISHNYIGGEMNVTKCKISKDLLCDTNFYDQRFVCRYIVSRICNVLKKLAALLFEDSSNKELSSCDWTEALSLFNNTSMAIREKPASFYCNSSDLVDKCCSKKVSSSKLYLHAAASRRLLKLLCRMMEKALSFKSFSQSLIYLVNFERLIVGSFVDSQGTLCVHEHFELLRLLVSCHRTMRYLLMNSEASKSSSLGIFSENSSPYFWLLKSLSLVVGWSNSMSLKHDDGRVNRMIISLMDQTSYLFVTICKHNFGLAIHSALRPKETKVSKDPEGNCLIESSSSSKSSKDIKSWESLAMVVEALEVETKTVFPYLKEAFSSRNIEAGIPLLELNKLLSVVSCIQGFIWGLECALSDIGMNYKDLKAKLMKHNYKTMSRIINFLDMVVRFIGESSQIFICSDALVTSSCDDQDLQNLETGSRGLRTDASLNEPLVSGSEFGEMPLASSEFQVAPGCSGTSLVELDSFSYNHLRTDLLQSFSRGENLEAAYFLRRLLISTSAIMRLNMLFKCSPLSSNTVQNLSACSGFLLRKFSQLPGMPNSYTFLWLDGTVQFLEALGSQFPLTENVYAKLVELNINAIGKCISLQGKGATSISHDIESVTKLLTQNQVLEPTLSGPHGLDDVRRRLRNSFKVLIEKPSELHLLSVMQALQQALTGNRVGFTAICDLQMGITEGGIVSPMVAAGVDCLDLLLEFLKGNKLWSLVKTQLSSLIASLFNIVVHLQGPTLFYGRPNSTDGNNSPDSGSVGLMCVEVLTRIAGKPTLFHLESHHVSQSLHLPGILFQSFCSLKTGKASHQSLLGSKDSKESEHFGCGFLVDRVFSMNLYAASCRLLWTVVKHHKSDCVRCIFLLQTSLQALLHCLEQLSTDTTDDKGFFTWEVEEGVKCASYLRRVYEEIRQQKDVFGQHGFKFLSDYICVFSGYGLLKQGLKREVDEALRPGVYALIDICSPDDLQHLHTVFGEGPRRSTLASLKHDYEHNFKYGGKV